MCAERGKYVGRQSEMLVLIVVHGVFPIRSEQLFFNDVKESRRNYDRPLHNWDNFEHPSNSISPTAFQESFIPQRVLQH
jgi:hypothetical protein